MEQEQVRWAFATTWFDERASLNRHYSLFVYPNTREIEMIDNKNNKSFLRRTKTAVPMNSFYLGGTVTILGRQLNITDYADKLTQRLLGQQMQDAVLVLGQSCLRDIGAPMDALAAKGLTVVGVGMGVLDGEQAIQVGGIQGLERVGNGLVCVCDVLGKDAVNEVSSFATGFSPDAYACTSAEGVAQLKAIVGVGGANLTYSQAQGDSSLLIVKPHAVVEGNCGQILHEVQDANLNINAIKSTTLSRAGSLEFLEVYKGVLPEYHQLCSELESGMCVAVEVFGDDAHSRLRALCGPHDSELARHVRPNTLRAKFGKDKVKNAVHCTDLPDDAPLEIEYFFHLLK